MRNFLLLISIAVALLCCKRQPDSAVILTDEDGEIFNFAKAASEKDTGYRMGTG